MSVKSLFDISLTLHFNRSTIQNTKPGRPGCILQSAGLYLRVLLGWTCQGDDTPTERALQDTGACKLSKYLKIGAQNDVWHICIPISIMSHNATTVVLSNILIVYLMFTKQH